MPYAQGRRRGVVVSRRAHRAERPPALDLALLAGALAVIAGTAWVHDGRTPEWNPFSVVALACVPVLIRFGMVVESATGMLRASTAPAILFAYDLREPQLFLPCWAIVVLASHVAFFGGRRGIGRGSVEVLAGAAMVGVAHRVDVGLWPLDRVVSATVAFCVTVVVLELLRSGGAPGRLFDGVRRSDVLLVVGGLFLACVVVVMLRTAYNDTPKVVTGLLGAGCLAAFVTAQILMARLQANVRGVEALSAAGQAMPWPGPQIDALLVRFVRAAVRAGDVRILPEPAAGPGVLSVPLEGGTHLVVERTRGDLPFNRSEAGLLRSLAGLASTARTQAVQQSQLLRQATTDDLTGLPTYAQFRLKVEPRGHGRSAERRMVVIFLDLDGFTGLTARIGHLDSDLVLRELGERLRTRLPPGVEVCRFGSDEFVVLGTFPDDVSAQRLERSLRAMVEEPMAVGDQILQVTASLGVATSHSRLESIDSVIRRAEARMREAKSGRRRPKSEQQAEVIQRLLDEQGFEVVLHPLVATGTGELEGVEALLRSEDEVFGRLSPLVVVDSAERADLLDEMTETVARQAIDAVRRIDTLLGRQHLLTVNVEFSQLRRDSPLLQTLVDLVAEHHVSLALEVSERAFDGWTDEIDEIAQWLRRAGISLAIDDFGAGYSTYALLNHWSWDLVKLDRSLVVGDRPAQRRLLAHVSYLLRDLGFAMVAEGIEDEQQWDFVEELGIEWIQGWVICRPMRPDELLERLRQQGGRFAPA